MFILSFMASRLVTVHAVYLTNVARWAPTFGPNQSTWATDSRHH